MPDPFDPAMLAATGQIGQGQQQPSQGVMNLAAQIGAAITGVNFTSQSPGIFGVFADTPGIMNSKPPSVFGQQINMPASALGRQVAACFVSKDQLFPKQEAVLEHAAIQPCDLGGFSPGSASSGSSFVEMVGRGGGGGDGIDI